jgi:hypothetical protein
MFVTPKCIVAQEAYAIRVQKPVTSLRRFSCVIWRGRTIKVGTITRARSVMMFITALYVRTARCIWLVWAANKTHDVYAFWVVDVPSLRRRALERDEEHGTQPPKYSKHSCSMHHLHMVHHRCQCRKGYK